MLWKQVRKTFRGGGTVPCIGWVHRGKAGGRATSFCIMEAFCDLGKKRLDGAVFVEAGSRWAQVLAHEEGRGRPPQTPA